MGVGGGVGESGVALVFLPRPVFALYIMYGVQSRGAAKVDPQKNLDEKTLIFLAYYKKVVYLQHI